MAVGQGLFLAGLTYLALAFRPEIEDEELLLAPASDDCSQFPKVEGYNQMCSMTCRGLLHKPKSSSLASQVDECRQQCDKDDSCRCFTFSANGQCRVGFAALHMSRSTAEFVAYAKMELLAADHVVTVASADDLPGKCKPSQKAFILSQCGPFFHCAEGSWQEKMCPLGFAFNPAKMKCEWFQTLPHCAALATQPLMEIGCQNNSFLLARGGDDSATQQAITENVQEWASLATTSDFVRSRPEGQAAQQILRVVKFDVVQASRWAVFSRDHSSGQLFMQAVALVMKNEGNVDIMAVVSRRSLLKDAVSVSGGGKALLAGIFKVVSAEDEMRPVIISGTPGDKYVEAAYLKHGMQVVGRSESGAPSLELHVPAECTNFMIGVVLCNHVTAGDYASVAWRLIPFSSRIYKTCAHMMPAELYLEKIKDLLKCAN